MNSDPSVSGSAGGASGSPATTGAATGVGQPGALGQSGGGQPAPVTGQLQPTTYELDVYKTVALLYNAEETTFWARNTVLVGLEAAMLAGAVAILGAFAKDLAASKTPELVKLFRLALLLLCAIGSATSIIWMLMVRRGAFLSHVIETRMSCLEGLFKKKYNVADELMPYSFWRKALEYTHTERLDAFDRRSFFGGFRLSKLWTLVGGLFLAAWLAISALAATAFWKHDATSAGTPAALPPSSPSAVVQ